MCARPAPPPDSRRKRSTAGVPGAAPPCAQSRKRRGFPDPFETEQECMARRSRDMEAMADDWRAGVEAHRTAGTLAPAGIGGQINVSHSRKNVERG
jgi:hypothetical protein